MNRECKDTVLIKLEVHAVHFYTTVCNVIFFLPLAFSFSASTYSYLSVCLFLKERHFYLDLYITCFKNISSLALTNHCIPNIVHLAFVELTYIFMWHANGKSTVSALAGTGLSHLMQSNGNQF